MAMRSIGAILAGMGMVGACTPAQQATAVVDGQLFCAKLVAGSPLTVALADALGVPIIVQGMASAIVRADCALIGAIPVSPPLNVSQTPVVAVPVKT